MITLLIIVGLGFAFVAFAKKNIVTSGTVGSNSDFLDITTVSNVVLNTASIIQSKFDNSIRSIHSRYNLSIPVEAVYACIYNESSAQVINGKQNRDIIGDNGRAIGFMQVTKMALPDISETEIISFQELYEEEKNLIAGSLYLNLGFLSAKREGSINPVRLSFKKYNGGIDETDNSLNSMADNYADKAYYRFLVFKNLII
jgi:hypothetical protein